jgi:hypothetical protein
MKFYPEKVVAGNRPTMRPYAALTSSCSSTQRRL